MQEVSAIYTIRAKYSTLSEKEKRIADFILQHPKESVNPSIEALAERIGISESTMVRFARKLGYSGYQRFRIALARETVPPSEQLFETDLPQGEDPVALVFANARRSLEATYEKIDRAGIQKAAKRLCEASAVYLMGLGGSNILAQDAYHKLIRTGINCHYACDYHLQLMLASQATSTAVAVLISHTGSAHDTLALAEELHSNGCFIIVLTSNTRSPLARLADLVLLVSTAPHSMVSESFSARITSLVLIDILYVEVLGQLGEQGMEQLNKMRGVIAKRRI